MEHVLSGDVVELVLERLDRLTQEEVLNTAAQTIEVIYSLVQITTVVMNGEQTHSDCKLPSPEQNFV